MKIGAVYPQTELRGDPAAVRTIALADEQLGFDYLLAYDHVLGAVHTGREPPLPGPYTEHDPFHDPFVMFAYLAGITERLEFTTGVIVLPQRQTALVARWTRQEEQIELLRRLFDEPVVDFTGRFDRVDRAALLPRPTRPIPIWIGGFSEKAYDRGARLADGFIYFGSHRESVVDRWCALRGRVRDLGRDAEDFGGEWAPLPVGGAAEHAADLEAWREVGGTHAAVVTMGLGLDSVDAHVEYLAAVATSLGM